MSRSEKIRPEHLARPAFVYVRQSTVDQVRHHPESRRRQYDLATHARTLGWPEVVVLDEEGSPVAERNEWPATPMAVDDNDWPGPLLPGAKRHVTTGFWHPRLDPRVEGLNVEVEVTDIRIWKAEGATTVLERQV